MALSTTLIKSIQDIMRQDAGVDGDAQRLSQISWLLFLKIFDDQEIELELRYDDYVSPIPDDLRWRHWAADAEGLTGDALLDLVNNRLFTTLKGLNADLARDPRAAVVQAVFEDAFNYMKSGQLLRQVINRINEIDFNNQHECHLFNDLYEKILKDLQSAGNAGEFYTPRAVTQFMVDQTDPQLGEAILDPACGTGGFLACTLEHLRAQVQNVDDHQRWQQAIHGVEKKQLPHPPHRGPCRAGASRQCAGRRSRRYNRGMIVFNCSHAFAAHIEPKKAGPAPLIGEAPSPHPSQDAPFLIDADGQPPRHVQHWLVHLVRIQR